MASKNRSPARCGDSGRAHRCDLAWRQIEARPTPKSFCEQVPIRAEIIGADQCRAEGIGVRGAAPVLAICRKLIAAGLDPARPLHAFRGNVLCLVVRRVGEAARFVVDERRMTLARWKPFSGAEVSPSIAPRDVAAIPLPAAS